MIKVKQRKKIKIPEGTWTTSPVIIMDKNAIIQEIANSPPKKISRRIQIHLGILNKENLEKLSDDGGGEKTLAKFEDESCSLIMGIPTKEWDDIPSPVLIFYQTSSQAVLKMEANIEESQEALSQNNHNANIMRVGDTILDTSAEAGIDENWCLLDNHLM